MICHCISASFLYFIRCSNRCIIAIGIHGNIINNHTGALAH